MHPYTKGLVGSVLSQYTRGHPLLQIAGMTSSLLKLPAGWLAHRPDQLARCWRATA